jgi:hypothetical protein
MRHQVQVMILQSEIVDIHVKLFQKFEMDVVSGRLRRAVDWPNVPVESCEKGKGKIVMSGRSKKPELSV